MRKQIVTVVAAGALGITSFAVAGPALAAVGATDAATAVTARVDRVKQALAGLVTDGTLTQAQADKVATTLGSTDIGPGGGRGGHGGPGKDLSAAATALGLSESELHTALQDGKSLAHIAGDKGVPVDKVITALVDAEKARIAQSVTDGRITQAQADERLADLTARVTDRVNSVRPARPDRAAPSTEAPSAEAPTS